jgi:CHAT domain-containing protein
MDGEVFVAQQAKKSYFLKEASSAGFLHLAVHGELDASSPSYSRLWFGDEESEALTALEIYDLSLQAQLAVLSACNSGLGDPLFGNGLLSLAQAFRMAGIGSTVMSLWEVPDRESAAIMEYFYHHLKSGLSKDEALRQAKLTYLENQNDPALQHPFYWAGFVVLGDYDPVSSSPWWYWGIVLFLFGGGAFLLWIPISKWYSLKYRSGEN